MLTNKKLKLLIYIILLVFTLSFLFPICAYAIYEDSIYVWSNNTSSVSTSNTPDTESLENNNESKDDSR